MMDIPFNLNIPFNLIKRQLHVAPRCFHPFSSQVGHQEGLPWSVSDYNGKYKGLFIIDVINFGGIATPLPLAIIRHFWQPPLSCVHVHT